MRPCNCNNCEVGPYKPEYCRLCWLANNDARYQELWGLQAKPIILKCIHLGEPTGEVIVCLPCNPEGGTKIKTFKCTKYGQCTLRKYIDGIACCNGTLVNGAIIPCPEFTSERKVPESLSEEKMGEGRSEVDGSSRVVVPKRKLSWSYGVTTVPERKDNLLPRTLASLSLAGFETPRLFVDGATDGYEGFGLEVTYRSPKVFAYTNWFLALTELYFREPTADRYAIFQDDFVTYPNLRDYLEGWYPEKGYLNLYTMPSNHVVCPRDRYSGQMQEGWFKSNQFGRGAVALVLNRDAVMLLLSHPHMLSRPQDIHQARRHKNIDGAIISTMIKGGYTEYVHNPSLVQHTGDTTTIKEGGVHLRQPRAPTFRGEEFDAMQLIHRKEKSHAGT